ncbi:hypothetical protein IAR55_000596 [Kwoniella newhampshirensis]|uniref:BHLH domain-containing protein n=1 Tax=Kwoniella newhampshirensis TaxID=1651941 RepID=A0AAW0Z7B7_9TREE
MEPTTTSSAVSPSSSSFPSGQDSDLFSLDFLALTGIDPSMSSMTSPQDLDRSQRERQNQHQNQEMEAGPSDFSPRTARNSSKRASMQRQGGQSTGQDTGHAMDVDEAQMEDMLAAMSRGQDEDYARQEYDAVQSAILQQQLQAIHMQSPLGFDISNPNFPLGQLFLSSPEARQALHLHQSSQGGGSNQHLQSQHSHSDRNGGSSKWQGQSTTGGMPTPGSGEIMPSGRADPMSPMHLEMFARSQGMDVNDPNMMPLLSPALSQHTSTSNYASPTNHVAFSSHSHRNSLSHSQPQPLNKSPIEQLQEQQRQFQEQLASLQQQQLEMQATAAAVIAASTSPYIASSGHSSTGSRPATTPGITPSSAIFSPLTSPALEATNRASRSQGHSHQHFSPAVNGQQLRGPHPLSALSSPALNPVGSSGGAQQTLSPALGPQNNGDLTDPEYLRALVGFMDSNNNNSNVNSYSDISQPTYHSPSMASTSTAGHSTILASPALNPSTGPGPHRHPLPLKSRPSPMLKPTGHRSHNRTSSTTGNGNYSVPTSPSVQKSYPSGPGIGLGYLPPSAVDQRHLNSNVSNSTTSTPSPVDLSHIMPPPPVPNGSYKGRKGVTPMTPASLMNLAGDTEIILSEDSHQAGDVAISYQGDVPAPTLLPRTSGRHSGLGTGSRTAKSKPTAANGANTNGNGTNKKAVGNKAGSMGASGKRALAIRPQGGVGVRAATKASAAAAAASQSTEPETRKTSHKAAEQKRRDSLKAGFDELRLLLPPINTEALDAETGEPIPGSSAPRLLPKSSLVPDDNPNRGVSKVALLRFGNEFIEKLKERVDKRDDYIEKLREEVSRLRKEGGQAEREGMEDLLEFDWKKGEDEEFDGETEEADEEEEEVAEDEDMDVERERQGDIEDEGEGDTDDVEAEDEELQTTVRGGARGRRSLSTNTKSPALRAAIKRPGVVKTGSSSGNTVMSKRR